MSDYINSNIIASSKGLTTDHFKAILDQALAEITVGKGNSRHGKGDKAFSEQPWRYITDGVGTGFPIGQAIKKLIELKNYHEHEDPSEHQMISWKREALGAIVYIIMSIMWYENQYFKKNLVKNDNTGTKEDI